MIKPAAHLFSCASWHLRQTARAFQDRNALAGLYISDKNNTGIKPELYHRCWPFHLAMKPFYHTLTWPVLRWEPIFYRFFPIWKSWLLKQKLPDANIMMAIGIFAKEVFDLAEETGALKVFDAPNSHPVTQRRLLQAEYDRWCPGLRVPRELDWYANRAICDAARADVVLCPSLFVRDSMLENGIPQNRLLLASYGVDTSIFKPRSAVPDTPRFIAVGTICLRKGYQYLFRAFAEVKKRRPDAELLVVGNYRPDFKLERPKWDGLFTTIKTLSHQQLAELFSTCTAFLMPSAEEGYARVIAEALAAGLPVVATHESGASTNVTHAKEGFIVPSGNVDELTKAMLALADDRELNEAMSRNAAETGRIRNTWQDYGDRLLADFTMRLNHNPLPDNAV